MVWEGGGSLLAARRRRPTGTGSQYLAAHASGRRMPISVSKRRVDVDQWRRTVARFYSLKSEGASPKFRVHFRYMMPPEAVAEGQRLQRLTSPATIGHRVGWADCPGYDSDYLRRATHSEQRRAEKIDAPPGPDTSV